MRQTLKPSRFKGPPDNSAETNKAGTRNNRRLAGRAEDRDAGLGGQCGSPSVVSQQTAHESTTCMGGRRAACRAPPPNTLCWCFARPPLAHGRCPMACCLVVAEACRYYILHPSVSFHFIRERPFLTSK